MFGKKLKSFVAGLLLLALPSMSLGQASDPITFTTDDANSVSAFLFNLVGGTGLQTSSVQAAIPTITIAFDTTGTGAPWVQGGNTFGALGVLGTLDANDVSFIRDSVERIRLNSTGFTGTGTSFVLGPDSTNKATFSFAASDAFLTLTSATDGALTIDTPLLSYIDLKNSGTSVTRIMASAATTFFDYSSGGIGFRQPPGGTTRVSFSSDGDIIANGDAHIFGQSQVTTTVDIGGGATTETALLRLNARNVVAAVSEIDITAGGNTARWAVDSTVTVFEYADVLEFSVSPSNPIARFTSAGDLELDENLATIRGVSYVWPASQGAASTFLQNDGSGNLSWVTAATAGLVSGTGVTPRVAYWSGTNTLTSDANFLWRATEKFLNVGIIPGITVGELGATGIVVATEGADIPAISLWAYSTTTGPIIIGHRHRGTNASPAAILTNDLQLVLASAGHDGTNFTGFTALLTFLAQENFTPTAQGTAMQFATIGLGTTSLTEKMRLTADGSLGLGTSVVTGAANITAVGTTYTFGNGTSPTTMTVGQADASGPNGDTVLRIRRGSLSSGNDAILAFNNNGATDEGRIQTNVNGMFLDHNLGFNIRTSTASPVLQAEWTTTGLMTETATTPDTSTTQNILTLAHDSTGTPAAGFGSRLRFRGDSATAEDRDMAAMEALWTTATDASRTADIRWLTVNNAAALTEQMRLAADGDFTVKGNSHTFGTAGTATTIQILGGGTIIGSTGSGENITLQSTTHGTKGVINLDDAVVLWPNFPNPTSASTVRLVDFNKTYSPLLTHTLYGISFRPNISPSNQGPLNNWFYLGGTHDYTGFDSTSAATAWRFAYSDAAFTTTSATSRPPSQFVMVEDATTWESNNVDLFNGAGSLGRHRAVDFNPIFRVVGASAAATFGITNVQPFRVTPTFSTATAGQKVTLGTLAGYNFTPAFSGPGSMDVTGNIVAFTIGTAPTVTFTAGGAFISLSSTDVLYEMRHVGPIVQGASAAPTNASVGIEIQSTTKAFLPSRMTDAQRTTLTGVAVADGMILYDSTRSTHSMRQNGRWNDVPGWSVIIVKSADQTVTNTTTLTDDTELQWSVGANETWHVQCNLAIFGNNTASDAKVGFTASGASFVTTQSNWEGVYYDPTLGTIVNTAPTAFASTTQAVTGGSGVVDSNVSTTAAFPVKLEYRFRTTAAVTVKIQFALLAAAAAGRSATMESGSMCLARRMI